MANRIALAVVALLFVLMAPAQGQPLELLPGEGEHSLTPHLRYYHDTSSALGADEVFERAGSADFQPLPGGRPTFGFQAGAFWFHAVLINRDPAESRRLLVQQYPLSDRVDLYVRDATGTITHQASGDALPFDNRAVEHRQPNFRVDLPPGEPVELLVRVESQSSMQVPLVLYTHAAFTSMASASQIGIGLYYGILLALFFYNLILWITLRDAGYFWYMAHISAFGLVLFCLNGLAFEHLWPDWLWVQDKCVPVSICLAQIFMQQFVRYFLELDKRWRAADKVSLALIAIFVALASASLILPYRIATTAASALVLPSVLWVAVVGVAVLRRGYTPARIFLMAWAAFLAGTAAYTLVAFGVLPKMFITEYGVQVGSALEMVLLSFALAYRYAALRGENDRLVREANEQLERKVAERTEELRTALEQLAEVNRRDGLTGVFNRHHFRELLERHLRDARQEDQHLAVLMVDVDHFKRINDSLGHLAGDECIRQVARCMRDVLAPHGGVVARFGGEEFVAALPGMAAHDALVAAEAVRRAVAEQVIEIEDQTVRLTVSIGVHSLDTYRIVDPEDALRAADEALYSAKEEGRNCVRPVMP